jgi:hypothetical protein
LINSLITRNREYQGINKEFYSSGHETSTPFKGAVLSRDDPFETAQGNGVYMTNISRNMRLFDGIQHTAKKARALVRAKSRFQISIFG